MKNKIHNDNFVTEIEFWLLKKLNLQIKDIECLDFEVRKSSKPYNYEVYVYMGTNPHESKCILLKSLFDDLIKDFNNKFEEYIDRDIQFSQTKENIKDLDMSLYNSKEHQYFFVGGSKELVEVYNKKKKAYDGEEK